VTLTMTSDDPVGPCPSVNDQLLLTINPAATASAGLAAGICMGNNFNLAGAIGGGASTLTWVSSGSGTFNNSTIANAVYTPSAADITNGSVTLTLITDDPAGACSSVSSSMILSIGAEDNAAFSYASNSFCQNASDPVATISGTPNGTFTSMPAGLNMNAQTGQIILNGSTPGTYAVMYSTNGACPNTDTLSMAIYANPVANAGSAMVLPCNATSISLNGSGNGSFNWTTSNGNIVSGANTASPSVSQPGLYTMTLTDNNGCTASSAVNVTMGTITAAFNSSIVSGTAPLDVAFTNASNGATNYIWQFGNATTSTQVNPSTTFASGGMYQVILFAQAGTCTDSASVYILVDDDLQLTIPNIFSPNGDGINDQFFVSGIGVKDVEGVIFNRWGEKVYSFQGLNTGWDGKNLKNEVSSDGTYFLLLKVTGTDGKLYDRQASIQLMR
jgi:trimeric autotransporter adhesin